MPPKLDSLVPPSQSNKRLFYQGDEKEIIFRDSSVINSLPSSHLGSDSIQSSSRSISLADDQLSTEPIPIDFDQVNLFRSSPFYTQQVTPGTALNVPNQIDSGNSASLSHQVQKPKLKMDKTAETSNNERQLRPRLTHRDPPITSVRGRQVTRCINGFDGSVEGHSSADGEGLANPAPGTEGPKSTDDDDDEYQLSKSENDESESEQFTVNDIKKLRKTTNKKHSKTTYSSKPRAKQAAKAKAAPITVKQTRCTVTNKITVPAWKRPGALNQVVLSPERLSVSSDEASPVRQNTRTTVGGSNKKGKDVIPDSQDFVKDSQENAIPPKTKSKTTNIRRPKMPFYQDSLNTKHINLDETTSAWDITDTYQQSTAHQGKALSPSPGPLVNGEVQAGTQSEPIDFSTHQPETARSRGNNIVGLKIDKGKARAIDQNHPSSTSYEVDSPQVHRLSDQTSQSEDVECVETCLQSAPPYHTETETNEILDNLEPSELSVNEMKVTPNVRDRFKHIDVYTPVRLHQLNSGPVRLEHVVEAKNEATQTDVASAQQLLREICYPGTFEEGVLGNSMTKRWFLRSPGLEDVSRPSRASPVTVGARKEYEQSENPEKGLSMKKYRNLPDKTTPLHPTSRAWAQGIAKKSRQNNLKTSAPQMHAGEDETLGRTSGTIQESNTNPISKRETALGDRRSAIVDSVQEITMTVLQHLESKESSIESIVGIYQQRGQQILSMLLDRQSIELRQAASDFDGSCIRIEKLFEESTRHARTIGKRISSENNRHLRDCAKRSKELEETIKLARGAVASI